MKLPLRAHFGWKYLESLQKKDASQGLNTGGNTRFLSFVQLSFDTGSSGWSGKRWSCEARSGLDQDVTVISGPAGHESLKD